MCGVVMGECEKVTAIRTVQGGHLRSNWEKKLCSVLFSNFHANITLSDQVGCKDMLIKLFVYFVAPYFNIFTVCSYFALIINHDRSLSVH